MNECLSSKASRFRPSGRQLIHCNFGFNFHPTTSQAQKNAGPIPVLGAPSFCSGPCFHACASTGPLLFQSVSSVVSPASSDASVSVLQWPDAPVSSCMGWRTGSAISYQSTVEVGETHRAYLRLRRATRDPAEGRIRLRPPRGRRRPCLGCGSYCLRMWCSVELEVCVQ